MAFLEDIHRESISKAFKFVATFTGGIVAGSSFYIPCVEHPTRMAMSPEAAMRNWFSTFHFAKRQGQICGVIGMVAATGACAIDYNTPQEDKTWLISAVLMTSITPFTLCFIKPTNDILLQTETIIKEKDEKWIKEKLNSWCNLHNVRVAIMCGAMGTMLYSIIYK